MNDKKDPLPPPNATDAEVAKFWETHSLADYEQELNARMVIVDEEDETL